MRHKDKRGRSSADLELTSQIPEATEQRQPRRCPDSQHHAQHRGCQHGVALAWPIPCRCKLLASKLACAAAAAQSNNQDRTFVEQQHSDCCISTNVRPSGRDLNSAVSKFLRKSERIRQTLNAWEDDKKQEVRV